MMEFLTLVFCFIFIFSMGEIAKHLRRIADCFERAEQARLKETQRMRWPQKEH